MTNDDTDTNSADPAVVTAVNSTDKSNMAPASPEISDAAVGATSPLSICSGVRETLVATAANPRVVASANGMANHALYPLQLILALRRLLFANTLGRRKWSRNCQRC